MPRRPTWPPESQPSTIPLELITAPQPFAQNVPDRGTVFNVHSSIIGSSNTSVLTALYTLDIISPIGTFGDLGFQSAQAL